MRPEDGPSGFPANSGRRRQCSSYRWDCAWDTVGPRFAQAACLTLHGPLLKPKGTQKGRNGRCVVAFSGATIRNKLPSRLGATSA